MKQALNTHVPEQVLVLYGQQIKSPTSGFLLHRSDLKTEVDELHVVGRNPEGKDVAALYERAGSNEVYLQVTDHAVKTRKHLFMTYDELVSFCDKHGVSSLYDNDDHGFALLRAHALEVGVSHVENEYGFVFGEEGDEDKS